MGHNDSNCGISEDLQSAQHNQNRCLRPPTLLGIEAKAIPVTSYIKTLGVFSDHHWAVWNDEPPEMAQAST